MTRRQKILLGAVALVLVLLYTGAAATAGGSSQGNAADRPGGLVGWLGHFTGKPAKVDRSALSAPCLAGTVLTVKDSCVLTVAAGNGTRRVALHADDAVSVTSRPPGQQQDATSTVEAGHDVDVTVDKAGGRITFTCACTVHLT